MTRCDRCGGHVTPSYRRVFADEEGRVFGCPRCMDQREILDGEPARPPGEREEESEGTRWRPPGD
jgi:hypothetical protein